MKGVRIGNNAYIGSLCLKQAAGGLAGTFCLSIYVLRCFPAAPGWPLPAPSYRPCGDTSLCSPVVCFIFLLQPSLSVLVFQMDVDEDTAEKFYKTLLELEKQVRITIQKSDHHS